ncbi:MAG: hypothetical protein ACTHOO_07025 [Alcanivorax sp.]
MFYKYMTGAAVLTALMAPSFVAQAETVKTEMTVEQKALPNIEEVNFSAFDLNNDGDFTKQEIGERLFKSFDRDGNQMIDNIEWDHKTVMTIIPMEVKTLTYIDSDDDGKNEDIQYDYETFVEISGLSKFDKNMNGLSAKEFIEKGYQALDTDDDNLISLKEWKAAYELSDKPANADQDRYN